MKIILSAVLLSALVAPAFADEKPAGGGNPEIQAERQAFKNEMREERQTFKKKQHEKRKVHRQKMKGMRQKTRKERKAKKAEAAAQTAPAPIGD